MRVLVTGAAGFIGSCLSHALLQRGDEVIGFDNLDPFYSLVHKQRNLDGLRQHQRFHFVEGDVREQSQLKTLLRGMPINAVAHLAAAVSVRTSVLQPTLYSSVNVDGTVNMMDAARRHGLPRFVFTSTGSVYGRSSPVPFSEDASATNPLSPYAASKRAAEMFAAAYHNSYQLPVCVLRLFNVYGPHGRPDMMPWRCVEAIVHDEPITLFDNGRLQRDWTYIDDAVAALLAALDSHEPWGIINAGSGQTVTNRHFLDVLEQLLGRKAVVIDEPAPPSEPPVTAADISLARRVLGYAPEIQLEEGLKRFVGWLRREQLLPS